MHRLRRSLPSLTALVAFEAAARSGGFTRAATELGVTQAAISRRIAALEREVGQTLFDRRNRRVMLTDAGQRLFDTVRMSFTALADTIDGLRLPARSLTVNVSIAFGHFRLLPRLGSFREQVPDVDLRVVSQDTWTAPDDPQIDLAVRYGKPPFRGMKVVGSMPDGILPVCAPDVAARLSGIGVADLARRGDIARIDNSSPEPSWLNWAEWFRQSGWRGGIDPARLRFSSYSDAAYAAMAGDGVALGWTYLLERPLADGRLVALDLPTLFPRERHYILIPERGEPSAQALAFAHWLGGDGTEADDGP
ncbi:LysR substrate-binding domain-containing protein [Loktanella sp. DJP18]|uniref:LysR substrate-binding domain-containing protein n=1 Tax=Loktanella sp. DJP18 TaxID=3409788 RepID=UPI003BB6B17E